MKEKYFLLHCLKIRLEIKAGKIQRVNTSNDLETTICNSKYKKISKRKCNVSENEAENKPILSG